jgi:hypothetical protein
MCYRSPAKVFRSVRRITKFLEKKTKNLSITLVPQSNVSPEVKPLSFTQPTITNISPVEKCLSFAKGVSISIPPLTIAPARPRKLSFSYLCFIDIQPDPLFSQQVTNCDFSTPILKQRHHPHIVEACRLMYSKKPDELSPEESEHFQGYRQYKIDNGLAIEEDFVYKPNDS